MKKIIITTFVLTLAGTAFAKKVCTDQPKDKWMSEEAFKQKATTELGYKIKKFKTPGSCYEIYGWNKDGQKIETYFNPVDGSVVK